jgi:cullin-associated NEDD8-dissociated protein 1
VLRCPNEVGAYEDAIARTSLHYLAFDPNYADDDEMDGEDEGEADMEEEEEDDEDYSDDDDISWKVRRAAAKVRGYFGGMGTPRWALRQGQAKGQPGEQML